MHSHESKTIPRIFTDDFAKASLALAKAGLRAQIVLGHDAPELSFSRQEFNGETFTDAHSLTELLHQFFRKDKLNERERTAADKMSNFLTSGYQVISSYDPTPSTVFRNACMRERVADEQITDLDDYSLETSTHDWDSEDAKYTKYVRRNWDYLSKVVRKPEAFKVAPMFCADDWYALMLPRDNTVGEELDKQGKLRTHAGQVHIDYLGYHSEIWRDFIYDLADRLQKMATSQQEIDCIKLLLLDYASNVPEASTIAHDGRFRMKAGTWDPAGMAYYAAKLGRYWHQQLEDCVARPSDFLINLNGTKSVGSDVLYPDGTRYDPMSSRYTIVGISDFDDRVATISRLTDEQKQEYLTYMWARQDNSEYKLSWVPYLKERARKFIEWSRKPITIEGYAKMLAEGLVPIHTQSTRRNNGDVPKQNVEKNQSYRALRRHWSKKDRDYRYEIPGLKWREGVIDDLKYTQAYQKKRGYVTEEPFLKVRPVFPGNNVSFYPPWIQLATILMRKLEEGPAGFPSLHEPCFNRYQRWYSKHPHTRILTFDRRTAEQWITDNWSYVMDLLPGGLRDLVNRLGCVLSPSRFGPRVTLGALFSGTALTTFLNAITGGFEMCNTISRICHVSIQEAVDAWAACVMGGADEVEVGSATMCINLGTDDQILLIDGEVDEPSPSYFDERRLTCEICDDATVFGLHFTADSCSVSETLGLYKVFLFEKARLGDAIALKYSMRFKLLQKYVPIIEQCFRDHNFGSITDYDIGGDNYLKKVEEFGFSLHDLFDEFSFSDSIIMASGFTNYDPRKDSHKYPEQFTKDMAELFLEEELV